MGIAYRSVLKDIGTGGISVDSVTITNYPNTTTYMVGDKLNLSGLTIHAEIGSLNGDVTNDCTFTPANGDTITASTTKITVKYGSEKLDIPLTVVTPTAITITSQPTKTNYQIDEPLDFTGLVVTAVNSQAGLSRVVTSACTFNPAEGTTLDEENTYTISVSYGSLSTSFDVVCQKLPAWDSRGLNYNSWETIQTYIKAGLFNTVASVGQTKSFIINDKTYNAEVVSINDGTGDAGEWYPDKTVDFITKELYETNYPYRSNASNTGGFKNSSIKNTLNNTIYPLLPNNLKAVVIEKSHLYQCGEYFGSSWYTNMQEVSTNLWLPTLYETRASTGAKDENGTNNKQYTLSSLIKDKVGTTTASAWWLSSPYTGSSKNIYSISNSGSTTSGTSPTATYIGVPICFRVG